MTDFDYSRFDDIHRTVLQELYRDPRAGIIESALVTIASDKVVQSVLPDTAAQLVDVLNVFRTAAPEDLPEGFPEDHDDREMALVELYLCLHTAGAGYSEAEEVRLAERVGVRCLPGGMLPLLMAAHLITPDSVCADLGAGNGLQGLLLQQLSPHRRTIQVELSGKMIETGKLYQQALGLAPDKIDWQHGNIVDADLSDMDLIYLYRPARPLNEGNDLYRIIADKLFARERPVTIVSLADCLTRFLPERFALVYKSEFINIFRG